MKSYIGAKPFIFPQPVLLVGTYDKNDVPDIMNVAMRFFQKDKFNPSVIEFLIGFETLIRVSTHTANTIKNNAIACFDCLE